MSPPTRATEAGRTYLGLRALARAQGRPTDEVFVFHVLERFLHRLSLSPHRDRLVLKGGMLLAAFDERRPTADVDLLARSLAGDIDAATQVVRDVLAAPIDDGVAFDLDAMRAAVIRDTELYSGVRVVVPARIDRARIPLRIDINVGDPITPGPVEIDYPALLGEPFTVLGYPLETVLAEKVVTMVDRGDTTTRDRDFADVYVLSGRHAIGAAGLFAAIEATGSHRGSDLTPLRDVLARLGRDRQASWGRFVARSGLADDVPTDFATAIDAVADFADPILAQEVVDGTWDPVVRRWRS